MEYLSTDSETQAVTHWYLYESAVYGVQNGDRILDADGMPLLHGVLTPCQERELLEAEAPC